VKIKDLTADAPYIIVQQALQNGGESVTSSVTGTCLATRATTSTSRRAEPDEPERQLRGRISRLRQQLLQSRGQYVTVLADLVELVGHIRGNLLYGDSFGRPQTPRPGAFLLGRYQHDSRFRNFTIAKDPTTGVRPGQ